METTWELHTAELHLITTLWEVNLAKRYMTIKITQEVTKQRVSHYIRGTRNVT